MNTDNFFFRELTDKEIEKIYYENMTEDFPKSEIKSLELLLNCKKKDLYRCFGLYEGDKLLSYSYFANDAEKKVILLDYLAVVKDMRNSGYGSVMLSKIQEYFKSHSSVSNIIIEAESISSSKNEEEKEIRKRRISFYEKNGLKRQKFMANVFGTEFTILVLDIQYNSECGGALNEENSQIGLKEAYKNIYKAILTKKIYESNIFII